MDTENKAKEDLIIIRVQKSRKQEWKEICLKRQISLTSLIVDSVENRMMNDERKKVLTFIEKQDNIFIKIEANINQVARIANGQRSISEIDLKNFLEKLDEIKNLKIEQNMIFTKIYSLIADDS